jgi:hypothetical protein
MTTDPQVTNAKQEPGQESAPDTPERIDPGKVRVVDVEEKETAELIRRDCYDPDGGAAEMGDVMRLKGGELYLRAIDWARSKSHSEEVSLQWEPTGLTRGEAAGSVFLPGRGASRCGSSPVRERLRGRTDRP